MASPLRELNLARRNLLAYSSSATSLRSSSTTSRQYDSRAVSPDSEGLKIVKVQGNQKALFGFQNPSEKDTGLVAVVDDVQARARAKITQDFIYTERTHRSKRVSLSRDVSYRRDIPPIKVVPDGQRELFEAIGVKQPQLEPFPLPTDLGKLEELFLRKQGEKVTVSKPIFDPTPEESPLYESPMEDFEHQRFIEEVEKVKIKASRYHISKDKEAVKEGGLLFRTQSGLMKGGVSASRIRRVQPVPEFAQKPVHLYDGKPSGKREIELLTAWLEYMTYMYIDNTTYESAHEKTRAAQLIYTMCFKELIRQVSVHCAARGQLMDLIWNSSVDIFTKSEFAFVKELEELKKKFREVTAKSGKTYEEKLKIVTKKYADLNGELRKETKRADEKEKENDELKLTIERERKRLKDMQEAIKTLADVSVASKVEEERKRLAEEFALRAKPQVTKRTVSTSTTEDEYLLLESLEVSSVPELGFRKNARKSVVLQGNYDEKGRFHKTHELKPDSKGALELSEFQNALVTEIPAYHKETNTDTDLGWSFLDRQQLEAMRRTMLDIPEEEIARGLWVSDYREWVEQRKLRDLFILTALKSLWIIRHPVLMGVKNRGTQLFGHEIKESALLSATPEPSSASQSDSESLEILPLGPRRESIEVDYKLKSLEDFLLTSEDGKRPGYLNLGRVGLELMKTVEAAVSQDGVTLPKAVLISVSKMMINNAFVGKFPEGNRSPLTRISTPDDGSQSHYRGKSLDYFKKVVKKEPVLLSNSEEKCIQTDFQTTEKDSQTDTLVVFRTTNMKTKTSPPLHFYEEEENQVSPGSLVGSQRLGWSQVNFNVKAAVKRTHPVLKVLSDLKTSVGTAQGYEMRPAMHLKTLLKSINALYSDRVCSMRELPAVKRISLVESLYDQMLTKYGLRPVAEKKVREVLTTAIVSSDKSLRVRMFLEFAGLREKYTTEDWNCFVGVNEAISRWYSPNSQVGPGLSYDESALENFMSLERAEFITESFLGGKVSVVRTEEVIRTVKQLVQRTETSPGKAIIEKVSVDAVLELLINIYQELKLKVTSLFPPDRFPPSGFPLRQIDSLFQSFPQWRVHQSLILSELTHYQDSPTGEKTVLPMTLASILLDLNVYRDGD